MTEIFRKKMEILFPLRILSNENERSMLRAKKMHRTLPDFEKELPMFLESVHLFHLIIFQQHPSIDKCYFCFHRKQIERKKQSHLNNIYLAKHDFVSRSNLLSLPIWTLNDNVDQRSFIRAWKTKQTQTENFISNQSYLIIWIEPKPFIAWAISWQSFSTLKFGVGKIVPQVWPRVVAVIDGDGCCTWNVSVCWLAFWEKCWGAACNEDSFYDQLSVSYIKQTYWTPVPCPGAGETFG